MSKEQHAGKPRLVVKAEQVVMSLDLILKLVAMHLTYIAIKTT